MRDIVRAIHHTLTADLTPHIGDLVHRCGHARTRIRVLVVGYDLLVVVVVPVPGAEQLDVLAHDRGYVDVWCTISVAP